MAVVRRDGVQQTATFGTKSEAQRWAGLIEAEITKGKHLPPSESKRKTVCDLMTRYIKTVIQDLKDRRNPRRHAEFWINRLGNLKLNRLTPTTLVEVRDELAVDKAPGTVNRYMAAMSHACSLAEREWEWLDSNPVRKVKRLKEPRGRVRYLSNDERARLLAAARNSDHQQLYAIVLIALTTGARKSEILGLRWRNVDLQRGVATIEDTKNGERRSMPLVPKVIEQLKTIRKVRRIDVDTVFANPETGRVSYYYFDRAWRSARAAARLEDFRFHDLRHSCASYLAMNGATTAEIAAVLGHKTLVMVKRYSHLSDEHVRGVVERTAARILSNSWQYVVLFTRGKSSISVDFAAQMCNDVPALPSSVCNHHRIS